MKKLIAPALVFCLGFATGLAGWHLSAAAQADDEKPFFTLTETNQPALIVKLKETYRPTHTLSKSFVFGTDYKLEIGMKTKEQ